MSKGTKLDRLHRAPLFAKSTKKELESLAAAIDMIDVDAGHTLFRQGVLSHESFVIESGEPEVSIDGEVIATIPAGEMIGEIGLLMRSQASATVVATTPMTLLLIPHQRFDEVLDQSHGLGLAIARELAERLQATDARLH